MESGHVSVIIFVSGDSVTLAVDPGDGEVMSRKYPVLDWTKECVNPIAEHINAVMARLMSNGVVPQMRVRTPKTDPQDDLNSQILISLMGLSVIPASPLN